MKRNIATKIELSSELEDILKERLIYTNEFINAAIRFALESDEFKTKWLQQELKSGLEQADRGELYDLEEVMAEIHNSRPTCRKSSSAMTPAQI